MVYFGFGLGVLGHLGPKILYKIQKLYQVFMHQFFVSKCLDIIIIYFSYKKVEIFSSKGFDKVWSRSSKKFWAWKVTQEKSTKFISLDVWSRTTPRVCLSIAVNVTLLTLFRVGWGVVKSPYLLVFPLNLLQTWELTPKTFWVLVIILLPHWCKILRLYLVPVPNY